VVLPSEQHLLLQGRVVPQLNEGVANEQISQIMPTTYWGNRFWAQGYCVDTVSLDTEMIRNYVKYQKDQEK
jgi:putative transposase